MAMGRPSGAKNIMRTPEEKKKIVLEARSFGTHIIANKYFLSHRLLNTWMSKYDKDGIDGLRSQTGKHSCPNKGRPKKGTEIEELKKQLAKKDIEIERLKKGYTVKGVGARKEFVTTFDKNTK